MGDAHASHRKAATVPTRPVQSCDSSFCNQQIVAVAVWATRTLPAGKRLQCLPVASLGFAEQFAKPVSCLITSNPTRCHIDNELFPLADWQFPVGQKTVLLQKDE